MNKKKLIGCGLLLTSSMLMMPSVKAADDDLTLTFSGNGGTAPIESCVVNRNNPQGCRDAEDGTVLIKQGDIFPVAEREGYVFKGWTINNDYYEKLDYDFITTMNDKYDVLVKIPLTAQWAEINDVVKTDSNVSVTVPTTSTDVDIKVSNVVENTDSYTNISTLLKTSKFQAFDITITSQNVEITPDGKITVTVDVPEGYDSSSVTIYGIDENNTVTKLESTIENSKITFTSNSSYSYYAISSQSIETIVSTKTENIIETTEETIVEEVEEVNPDTGDNMKYVIVGTGIVMLLIGFVTSKLFKKRNS